MATTAGVYWCLVLTGCMSIVESTLTYEQSPSPIVCPGDELVFTCVTVGTGSVRWRINGNDGQTLLLDRNTTPTTLGSFSLKVTQFDEMANRIASTATSESAPVSLNGTSVDCAEGLAKPFERKFINYSGPPPAVTNISIEAIHNDSLFINWTSSGLCINNYIVNINGNNINEYNATASNTDITLYTLIIGTNYSFIIIPIDTIGREGPPSSLIQYIWNVPAQVVNISWDQISTDTITIWWNNTQMQEYSIIPVPPIQYYIISVYNTSNSIIYTNNTTNTNITITGLPLTDTSYTVSIIPVNIIGYGPSATVNALISLILMAATAGIYWCLVLVDLIVLSSAATLNQTSPSYTPVCPGNELMLTCTTYNTGLTFWKVPQAGLQQSESELIPKFGTVIAGLILNITKKEGTTVTSTGTYQSINESLNGSVVGCSGSSTDIQLFANFTINIRAAAGLLFPYSGVEPVRPKRFYLQHSHINNHEEPGASFSGIYIHTFDYREMAPLLDYVPKLKEARGVQCKGVYCGMPSYFPISHMLKRNWFLPAGLPPSASSKLVLESVKKTSSNSRNYTFIGRFPPNASSTFSLYQATLFSPGLLSHSFLQ
uniref:Fibronectin type-III domain-containing protein n=1 Tax=Amphimedon queenslandica TaxID=400682 RepID=A0A1X7TTI7_AMPQE